MIQAELKTPASVWGTILALTFLFHLGVLLLKWNWTSPASLPRVEVVPMSMPELEKIRDAQKQALLKQNQKSFLLKTDPKLPSAVEPNPDARYLSDRTVRVEKEQRAAQTQVIPQPQVGLPSLSREPSQPETQTKTASPSQEKPQKVPLSDFGFPYRFDKKPPAPFQPPAPTRRATPFRPGGDQALNEKNLPAGSQNILNTQESIYYSFYSRIYESIGPVWQSKTRETTSRRPLKPGEYVTVVDVQLTREGELGNIEYLRSSGIPELDQDVQTSWNRFKRFPNPPQALLKPDGFLHMVWTFTVQVGEGATWDYLPPERVN